MSDVHPALVEAAVDRWRGEQERWKLRINKAARRYEAVRIGDDDEPEIMESYPFGKNNAEDAFNLARDKACARAVLAAFAAGRASVAEREIVIHAGEVLPDGRIVASFIWPEEWPMTVPSIVTIADLKRKAGEGK